MFPWWSPVQLVPFFFLPWTWVLGAGLVVAAPLHQKCCWFIHWEKGIEEKTKQQKRPNKQQRNLKPPKGNKGKMLLLVTWKTGQKIEEQRKREMKESHCHVVPPEGSHEKKRWNMVVKKWEKWETIFVTILSIREKMIRNEIKAGAALLLLRKVTREEQQCREKNCFLG